jgi:hypothetical protein
MSGILTHDFDLISMARHQPETMSDYIALTGNFIVSYPRHVVANHPEPRRLPGQDEDVGLVLACAMRPYMARNSQRGNPTPITG